MKKFILLLLLSFPAWSASPVPLDLTAINYSVSDVARSFQINYVAPYLWIRFAFDFGPGTAVQYQCYKLDPTVPPVSTNGWHNIYNLWYNNQLLPTALPMTTVDQANCWK